ncbi:MAG: hypothetical protein SOY49_08145 [Prevotella sp.]|nr:hypothetical protein [Prevotella sp.]
MKRLTQLPQLETILSPPSTDEARQMAAEEVRMAVLAVSEREDSLTATYRTLRYTACHLLALNGTCPKGSMAEKN